jgi:hypothetical protein
LKIQYQAVINLTSCKNSSISWQVINNQGDKQVDSWIKIQYQANTGFDSLRKSPQTKRPTQTHTFQHGKPKVSKSRECKE